MQYQGCTKSHNCPREPGHTGQCGRIDKSIPPPARFRRPPLDEETERRLNAEVRAERRLYEMRPRRARMERVLLGMAPKTDLFQRGEHRPYEVVERYALKCGERIPDPTRAKPEHLPQPMISGPCIVEITTHRDGGFGVDVDREHLASHLYCKSADCGFCNPEEETDE